jgi:aldehyde:ferredoxin oxidoreductase
MFANWGKFLRVNLTTKEIKVETWDEDLAKK